MDKSTAINKCYTVGHTSLIIFYSVVIVCTGENEGNERRSSKRSSETGGRQNNIAYHPFNLASVWSLHALIAKSDKNLQIYKVCN